MERVTSGVEGLDRMLSGGLIGGRTYLVIGGPGAGKTILCMQYLMEGVRLGDRCLYVALEEQGQELKEDMATFGWDLQRIKILDTMQDIASGLWALKTTSSIAKPEFNMRTLVEAIRTIILANKVKRIVIDSLTSIRALYENRSEARREMLGFLNFLESTGCTTLLTSELTGPELIMEEFLASGVIKIHLLESEGERVSAIRVEKMRGSNFDKHMRPLRITDKGIVVFPSDSVFG